MPDYQKMYHALFNATTDAISTLQEAQQKTEELYMDSPETVLTQLPGGGKKEPDPPPKNPTRRKKTPPFRDER